MRIGIDVMQPHPDAELAERRARSMNFARTSRSRHVLAAYLMSSAIGGRILRNDQQLLDAGFTSLSASRSTSAAGRERDRRAAAG